MLRKSWKARAHSTLSRPASAEEEAAGAPDKEKAKEKEDALRLLHEAKCSRLEDLEAPS